MLRLRSEVLMEFNKIGFTHVTQTKDLEKNKTKF